MPADEAKSGGEQHKWEQTVREAGARAEAEVRRVITYLNDEVVPEVRRDGSRALRTAAAELARLAERMDGQQGPGASRSTDAGASAPVDEQR